MFEENFNTYTFASRRWAFATPAEKINAWGKLYSRIFEILVATLIEK